ncbi:MAG: MFS transporter [Streptosporangiales bacterium]|nr:MFS transporter [Streptosporangiales bacterium]
MALNLSTLNVALPHVVRHFDAGAVAANWVLLSFMLANTVLIVVFGRLADMYGRRGMYLTGLAVFTASSLLLGFSPTVEVLIALRVVQAVGAAMLLANSAAIITTVFPRRLLGHGLGVYTASFSVAQLLGPSVGGLLADVAGWQWVFWFNVPLGVLCLIWGAFSLRSLPGHGERQPLDMPGNLLLLVSLSGLLIALSLAGDGGWGSPGAIAGLAVFVLLAPLFVWVEHRSGHPVVDLMLFRHLPFAMAYLGAFVNTAARFSVTLLAALYFQSIGGDGAFEAGMKIMPLPLATIVASSMLGPMTRWASARTIASASNVLTIAGLGVILAGMTARPSYTLLAVGFTLVGAGSGVFFSANTTDLMTDMPHNRVGIANAVRLMLQNVGVVLGTALSLTILTAPLEQDDRREVFAGTISDVSSGAVGDLLYGYHWALIMLLVLQGIGMAAALAGWVVRRRPGPAASTTVTGQAGSGR